MLVLKIIGWVVAIKASIMIIASFNGVRTHSHHTLPLVKPYGLDFLKEFKDYPFPFNKILGFVLWLDMKI